MVNLLLKIVVFAAMVYVLNVFDWAGWRHKSSEQSFCGETVLWYALIDHGDEGIKTTVDVNRACRIWHTHNGPARPIHVAHFHCQLAEHANTKLV